MNQGFAVVIGMTVSYLFSLAGLLLAWTYYKKNKVKSENKTE